jgi:hypothetical protein
MSAVPKKLGSIDVPQADSLPFIRAVVEAIVAGNKGTAEISHATGFSERHVRYRLESAKILGLIDENRAVSPLGSHLAQSPPGSEAERELFRKAILKSRSLKAIAPNLLGSEDIDRDAISNRIQRLTGLAQATADRRTQVLAAWRRQTLKPKPQQL